MTFRVARVGALLFGSGLCALVYQVAWFRELRLIFGASTAASAAVLAVFMGGLGLGGVRLGKRVDREANALAFYAKLELGAAIGAALTPLLVLAADRVYIASGGSGTLGAVGATALRLLLSAIVLGPPTFLMGGTLPAAARAVESPRDPERRRVGALYAINTLGAVVGAVLANFLLLEVLGTRLTLFCAALVNLLVGMIARSLARTSAPDPAQDSASAAHVPAIAPAPADLESASASEPAVAERVRWFPPAAAALAGFSFMLMELVWYRMLAPILGGSSYTFGLILAVALVGIGAGGALYARTRAPSTLAGFATTCSFEAVFIAVPYALGDRVAIAAGLLRPAARVGFLPSVAVWTAIASFVVLPAAIVSGAQFPLVMGLYGRGDRDVGRDVGRAYLANTLGAIAGALAGGFGLMPLLGALGCWRVVVVALVGGALAAVALDARARGMEPLRAGRGVVLALLGAALLLPRGPGTVWRHAGIGVGRADVRLGSADALAIDQFEHEFRRKVRWEADGVESSVALVHGTGFAFIVNGKADGHALDDAPTQVMGGLLAAMLHPGAKNALVVGLGTGSTAGWLGRVPTVERVDVVEIEPAILRVARDCAPVNESVLANPRVHVDLADAREALRTTSRRYDIIFSEPSNPYRAGISSLYTVDFYRAAEERLEPGGYFVQWLQSYEVDGWTIATALVTLRQVFGEVSLWTTESADLLLVARREHAPIDVARLRERLASEPFERASRRVWRTSSAEGVLAHFTAHAKLADVFVERGIGAVNTDDQNLLEFAFARSVGSRRDVEDELHSLVSRLRLDRPDVTEPVDWSRVQEERWLFQAPDSKLPRPAAHPELPLGRVIELYHKDQHAQAFEAWKRLERAPASFGEAAMVADLAARVGAPEDDRLLEGAAGPAEHAALTAILRARRGDGEGAVAALGDVFGRVRAEPWVRKDVLQSAVNLAVDIARKDPRFARTLYDALRQPFAVEAIRDQRIVVATRIADATKDDRLCVEAYSALEPPLWEEKLLAGRASCYRRAGDPRVVEAEADFAEYMERAAPFGFSIPSRPPRPVLLAPPKDGESDAGTEGGR